MKRRTPLLPMSVLLPGLMLAACTTEAAPEKLTAEQSRLFAKCVETYDNRVTNPWAGTDLYSWCGRALDTDLPDGSHEKAVATAMERVGKKLMDSPYDEVAERTAERDVQRLRAQR